MENYGEGTTEWMDNYDNDKIDEIIDLNNGEKNFFKMWNNHIRLYSGLGNSHMGAVVMRSDNYFLHSYVCTMYILIFLLKKVVL